MKKLRPASFILLSALCVLILHTAVLAQEEVPAPYTGLKNPFAWTDTRAQSAGKSVFSKNCFVCHGDRGNEVIEVDFSTAEFRKKLESRPDYAFWRVSEGVPDKEMKAWKSSLSETERWQVLTYIWTLSSAAAAAAPQTPPVVANPTVPEANTPPATPAAGVPTSPAGNVPGTPAPSETLAVPGITAPGMPAAPANTTNTPAAVLPVNSGTNLAAQANADIGERLFTGETVFANRGPACLSCHNTRTLGLAGGGTLGNDLTAAFTDYGEGGLTSLLKKLRFPTMKAMYGDRPLIDLEIAHLALFLKGTNPAQPPSPQNSTVFFIASATWALLLIALLRVIWRQRLSGVRRQLVKGDAT